MNEQYGPLMVGTWHYENISDTQCYFERLTLTRKPVTIDGRINYQRGEAEPRF